MGVYALVSSVDCFIKLMIAALICMFGIDHLILYSGAMMIESGLVMVVYMLVASRKYIECRYTTKGIDKELYKELISFSGWTFYGALSGMGMTQGSIILLIYLLWSTGKCCILYWQPIIQCHQHVEQ